jgi:hypothetical protein
LLNWIATDQKPGSDAGLFCIGHDSSEKAGEKGKPSKEKTKPRSSRLICGNFLHRTGCHAFGVYIVSR